MARSLCNCKTVSSYVVNKISISLKSCGYATGAASEGAVRGRSNVMFRKGGEEGNKAASSTPWVPDPKTGYYRPENVAKEIDAAELRQMLLNHKIHQN